MTNLLRVGKMTVGLENLLRANDPGPPTFAGQNLLMAHNFHSWTPNLIGPYNETNNTIVFSAKAVTKVHSVRGTADMQIKLTADLDGVPTRMQVGVDGVPSKYLDTGFITGEYDNTFTLEDYSKIVLRIESSGAVSIANLILQVLVP